MKSKSIEGLIEVREYQGNEIISYFQPKENLCPFDLTTWTKTALLNLRLSLWSR